MATVEFMLGDTLYHIPQDVYQHIYDLEVEISGFQAEIQQLKDKMLEHWLADGGLTDTSPDGRKGDVMSYECPETIPKEQYGQLYVTLNTIELVTELKRELALVGLKATCIEYLKNEYCPDDNKRQCSCPHWLRMKIENLHARLYEPNFWVSVCRRKRVYELRFYGMSGTKRYDHVPDDFWINVGERTQGKGYIHSYSLAEAAKDIQTAHQAGEILDYSCEHFAKYYASLFKKAVEKT